MSKKTGNFGRDEMTALLGGDLSETLTKALPSSLSAASKAKALLPSRETDFSALTTAQTAAMLKKNDLEKKQQPKQRGPILRAQRGQHVPNRHALLTEEQHRLLQQQEHEQRQDDDGPQKSKDTLDTAAASRGSSDDETSDDTEDQFASRPNQEQQRRKTEPQIVMRRQRADAKLVEERRRTSRTPHDTKRRRDYSSSSSSSGSDDKHAFQPRRAGDSSSDDSEQDDRRQRLLAKRRQRAVEVNTDLEATVPSKANANALPIKAVGEQIPNEPKASVDKTHQQDESSSSDSSTQDEGGRGSGEDSSSSSEEESSDDEPPAMAKPLFVPRHKRHTIVSQEQKDEQEKEISAKKKKEEENRKLQSRMMVAEIVAAASVAHDTVDEDEGGGASNAMPDDSDPTDPIEMEKERDAWEVRELERLLQAQDLLDQEEAEKAEYLRRRAMTDEERMIEDKALGLYQRPGEQRQKSKDADQSNFMQRYYHRGAFYMDNEEWDKDDVRHKAKDYERAATGSDKIDKRNLPKIMQVKNFGFARQNTKYKGLASEDTTDKMTAFLPLSQRKRQRVDRR